MAKNPNEEIVNLLQVIAIVELAREGVPQLEIQKILGVDMNKINRLARLVQKRKHE